MILVGEVVAFGRIVNVGENMNAYQERAKLTISDSFSPSSARPSGWKQVQEQRVMLKELEDRLNGEDESAISARRSARMADVSLVIIRLIHRNPQYTSVLVTGGRRDGPRGEHRRVRHCTGPPLACQEVRGHRGPSGPRSRSRQGAHCYGELQVMNYLQPLFTFMLFA